MISVQDFVGIHHAPSMTNRMLIYFCLSLLELDVPSNQDFSCRAHSNAGKQAGKWLQSLKIVRKWTRL